jgi:hypothetical protein
MRSRLLLKPTRPSLHVSVPFSRADAFPSMAGDSTAAFAERIRELGLSEHVDRFIAAGWFTLSNLAYGSNAGQTGSEERFREDILVKGLGSATHAHAPAMRRLYYEAFLIAAQDLRTRVEGPGENVLRQLAAPERHARFVQLQQRLVGLNLRGQLEPSHALIDRCYDMYTLNAVKHIPLELCTKRDLEVQNIVRDPVFSHTIGPGGELRLTKVRDETVSVPDCQFAMGFAIQRRGIALNIADVMSYESHEALHQRLVHALMKEPLRGFSRITVEQALEADAQFWTLLAEVTRSGVRRVGVDTRPCDHFLQATMVHPEFFMALMPRQTVVHQPAARQQVLALSNGEAAQPAPAAGPGRKKKHKGKRKAAADAEEERAKKVANAFNRPPPAAPPALKDRKKDFVKMPAALIGMCAKSSSATQSKRLCFGFNLGTCSAVGPGQECSKGMHLCMKPGAGGEACSKPHGALKCNTR